jgi:SAM-dependent methyltransferase
MRVVAVAGWVKRAANPWDRFYHHHESPWRGERAVADLLPSLGAGPVLELGCGNGKTLKPLIKAGVDAVGLDISWNILRRLPKGAPLALADASWLPFRDASFTAILDIHCTGHLGEEGRRRAALDMFRVLRPAGHLVVERLTPDDLRASQGQEVPGEPGMKQVEDGRQTHFGRPADIAAEFSRAGFEVVAVAQERREPGHRGRLVVRESARVLFRKRG